MEGEGQAVVLHSSTGGASGPLRNFSHGRVPPATDVSKPCAHPEPSFTFPNLLARRPTSPGWASSWTQWASRSPSPWWCT